MLIIIVAAIGMGFVSGRLLLLGGSAMNVLPWGVLTIAASFLGPTKRQAVKLSSVFAFLVSFSFLWFNNTDSKTLSSTLTLVALAAFASLFGLMCGALLGWLGWKIRHLF